MRSRLWSGLAIASSVLAVAGCDTTTVDATCALTQVYDLAGTPLTLIRDARIERIRSGSGDGFYLIGFDGSAVRWARLSLEGALGPEGSYTVPSRAAGPVFAVVTSGAGERVLVGTAHDDPAHEGKLELRVTAVSAESGSSVATETAAANLSPDVRFVMGSARSGEVAGLAWGDSDGIELRLLGPDAVSLTGESVIGSVKPASFDCLGFVPAAKDLALAFVEAPSSSRPQWRAFDLEADGSSASVSYDLMQAIGSCPVAAPVQDKGYVVGWQDEAGTWMGAENDDSFDFRLVVASGIWAGKEPPLRAIAPTLGDDYTMIFQHEAGPEAWRITLDGLHGAARPLVTEHQRVGDIAASPVDESLYLSYADYASAAGAAGTGKRYLVKLDCP